MNIERQLRKCNRILAAELSGPSPEIPGYQWAFSDHGYSFVPDMHFWAPLTELNVTATGEFVEKPVLEYACACGVDKNVHEPTCQSIIAARAKTELVKSAPLIERRWVLCRWLAPPTEADWLETYGTLQKYPREGRYIPVSANGHTVTLAEDDPPTEDATWLVVRMMREHWAKSSADERNEYAERNQRREWAQPRTPSGVPDVRVEAPRGSNFAKYRDQFRQQMTTYGQLPGKKHGVSYPTPKNKEHKDASRVGSRANTGEVYSG